MSPTTIVSPHRLDHAAYTDLSGIASLPYAFHVFSADVHLHFAASCQLEKTIWTAAIQDAVSAPAPSWVNEPPANFPPDTRPIVTAHEEQTSEYATPLPTPLPTIQSMSELEGPEDGTSPAPPAPSPKKLAKTMSRVDSAITPPNQSSFSPPACILSAPSFRRNGTKKRRASGILHPSLKKLAACAFSQILSPELDDRGIEARAGSSRWSARPRAGGPEARGSTQRRERGYKHAHQPRLFALGLH